MSDRKAYPSDLTDAQWEIMEPKPQTTSSLGGFHVQPDVGSLNAPLAGSRAGVVLPATMRGSPPTSEAFIKL